MREGVTGGERVNGGEGQKAVPRGRLLCFALYFEIRDERDREDTIYLRTFAS